MCLVVFGFKNHPEYNLIFASNRDEYYDRPACSARIWNEGPDIIAGKDLEKNGTWLAVRRSGSFAAVTNFRDPANIKPDAPSRGKLVTESLQPGMEAEEFLARLRRKADLYNGFNLLLGDGNNLLHFSNYEGRINKIKPGTYGLSNALLNTPWPKIKKAKRKFRKALSKKEISDDHLFEILTDTERFDPDELPETGLTPEMERAVSSIFIRTENYGTRCSTLLFIKRNGNLRFVERSYIPGSTEVENEIIHTVINSSDTHF
ncbi:MAG: NRDE family protein [Balneolaceae bacterium]